MSGVGPCRDDLPLICVLLGSRNASRLPIEPEPEFNDSDAFTWYRSHDVPGWPPWRATNPAGSFTSWSPRAAHPL